MSELRMYVEHLFEGRVLTAEMIELKEEIYGNLVARYEDYVASGMSEAEALERAKASITSIDDVLAGDDDASGEPSGAAKEAPTAAAAPGSVAAPDATAEQPAPATVVMPATDDAAAATEQTGATAAGAVPPTQPAEAPAEKKTPWMKVLAIAVAVIAVILVAMVLWNVVIEPSGDHIEDTVEDIVDVSTPGAGQNGNGAGNGQDATTGGNNASTDATGNQPSYGDPEDQREYEATMALLDAIDAYDCTALQVYSGESQPSASFFESLPLGTYVAADDTASINATSFTVYYANVPEDIDGDAIDRALVYNAAAAFSVYPNLETLNITVQEQYDAPYDADSYSFTRGHLESAFANVSGDAIVQFNSSLFESEANWDVVRQQIDRHEFCEHQVDIAEIG